MKPAVHIYNWDYPCKKVLLPNDEIHIWKSDLDLNSQTLCLHDVLNCEELERARKYKFDMHRNTFVVARGMLKVILASYLSIEAQNLKFVFNEHGKPSLDPLEHKELIYFNISHTNEQALFIFSRNLQVGIDVEYIQPLADYVSIAEQFCSLEEMRALLSAAYDQRLQLFYKFWTRQEALLKASGTGFTFACPPEARRWSVHDLDLESIYAAAFAYELERY